MRTSPWLPLLVLLHAVPAAAGDLEVRVTGLEANGGPVRVAVFASAADFESGRLFQGVAVEASQAVVHAVLHDLPPGTYAVAAFQDVDGDEALSRNLFGIPRERYGFSRGARGSLGPPSFEQIRISVGEGGLRLDIALE